MNKDTAYALYSSEAGSPCLHRACIRESHWIYVKEAADGYETASAARTTDARGATAAAERTDSPITTGAALTSTGVFYQRFLGALTIARFSSS